MLASVQKQNQSHRPFPSRSSKLAVGVEIFLKLVHFLNQFVQIRDLYVFPWVSVSSLPKIAENDPLEVVHLGHLHFKRGLDFILEQLNELDSVLVVDEPVVEDPHIFMKPKSHEMLRLLGVLFVRRANALKYLANISQVERVVGFFRRRKQLSFNRVVNI